MGKTYYQGVICTAGNLLLVKLRIMTPTWALLVLHALSPPTVAQYALALMKSVLADCCTLKNLHDLDFSYVCFVIYGGFTSHNIFVCFLNK